MNIPFLPQHVDKVPRIGRLSPLDVEVYDSIGDWYYFGKVETFEKEIQLDKEEKKLYFYRILAAEQEDERLIVTADDWIQNGNQIPYTQTERGRNRLFEIIMVAFAMIYGLTLYIMALFIAVGPSIVFYQTQVANLEGNLADIAMLFVFGAGAWAWAARYHHYVLDWQMQPLVVNSVRVSTDFYILTNSRKMPVYQKVRELESLKSEEVTRIVDAVRKFPKEEIDRLQEQVISTESELRKTRLAGFGMRRSSIETMLTTRAERANERIEIVRYVVFGVIVVALAVVAIMSGI